MDFMRRVKDKIFLFLVVLLSILAIAPIFHIVFYITLSGLPVILREGLDFFVAVPNSVIAERPGGIAPAIIGSLLMALTATILAAPIAVLAAIFSAEYPNHPLTRAVRVASRTFLEVASVLVAMLVFAILVLPMGRYSGLAGGVALAIVMVPYVYTYTELALLSVPKTYIEAGYSIGLKRLQVIFYVTSRVARRGIARGLVIGISKAMGETAPLLFTAFGARSAISYNLLEPMDAIPLMIYQFIATGYQNWRDLAMGASFLLLAIYLTFFFISRRLVKEVRV